MKEIIAKFEAKHSRSGYIALSDEYKCDCCGNNRICIAVDSSMGEYGPGKICLQCVDAVLGKYYDKLMTEDKEVC